MHCIGELIEAIAWWSGAAIALQPCLARFGRGGHHAVGADRDNAIGRRQWDLNRPECAAPIGFDRLNDVEFIFLGRQERIETRHVAAR
jgi:hypothetical protein